MSEDDEVVEVSSVGGGAPGGNTMANFWGWVRQDEKRLREEGGRKLAIVDGWDRFGVYHHNDNTAAELAINSALEAARDTDEVRWELLLRHWRLQLWLSGDLHRVLTEAVDLLNLTEDPRVHDVPQRVCAFHDIVDCHVQMDAAGYADEIAGNSQQVLAQLPRVHTCGDCARLHLAQAAAARGDRPEAEQWVARFYADAYDARWSGAVIGIADVYEQLGNWDEAEKTYQKACEYAKDRTLSHYLSGMLGIARARAAKGDGPGATEALRTARHTAKYTSGPELLARALAVEGYVAEAVEQPGVTVDYLTRAAREYLELARYRDAARSALYAAELARRSQLPEAEEALALAARATGHTPPISHDLRERLAAFSRQPLYPIDPGPEGARLDDIAAQSRNPERASLEEALEAHVAHGNVRGAALALYQLGRFCIEHGEPRAAVEYLIANAVLERILELGMSDREDALGALQQLSQGLPPGTVRAALAAAEGAPPGMIAPLLESFPPARWRWLVRAVSAEVEGKPAIEPEPVEREDGGGFEDWIDHVASMTTLVVRFRDRADPARIERWVTSMDESADEIEQQLGPNSEANSGGREVVAFARGLAALSRGETPEKVQATILPPFNEPIEQIVETAKEPLWRHPGITSPEFLVERAAQRAVRGLRRHDEHRATRLANLAFRFDLMAIDLGTQEPLAPIARFLEALGALVAADGARPPAVSPPLAAPFDAVLAAVYEAGKVPDEAPEADEAQP